jgi:hypothetical protein
VVVTDVSGQPIGPTFKGQAGQILLDFSIFENVTDGLFRNVGNYRSTLRNIREERISHLHGGESLKSSIERSGFKLRIVTKNVLE